MNNKISTNKAGIAMHMVETALDGVQVDRAELSAAPLEGLTGNIS